MSVTTQTMKAQRAKSPTDFEKEMSDVELANASIQRQFGTGQQMGIDPNRAAPAQIYQAGEMQRRQAATDPAFQTATAIGEREAGVQNSLAQALQKYRTNIDDITQKGQQSLAETQFGKQKGLWEVDVSRRDLGFSMYKNNAERQDAIQAAWRNGEAEEKLLEAGINHDMRLQDIEMYWTQVINEIEQELKDWSQMTQADWYKFQRDMETKSNSWAAIVDGGLGILSSVLGEVF
jgi:DNA-binding helix-hairpin-helix protein with protein kinase domain